MGTLKLISNTCDKGLRVLEASVDLNMLIDAMGLC